jgi:hypothetical protein
VPWLSGPFSTFHSKLLQVPISVFQYLRAQVGKKKFDWKDESKLSNFIIIHKNPES